MNLLASTFRNGLAESRASRRAISVFPTPVGPIMRMFFGVTSAAISGGRRCRRIRFRIATATARLAAAWPTTCRSSSATICRGVRVSSAWRSAVDSGRWMATVTRVSTEISWFVYTQIWPAIFKASAASVPASMDVWRARARAAARA